LVGSDRSHLDPLPQQPRGSGGNIPSESNPMGLAQPSVSL
jgi:hypothetical protein